MSSSETNLGFSSSAKNIAAKTKKKHSFWRYSIIVKRLKDQYWISKKNIRLVSSDMRCGGAIIRNE